MTYEEVKRIRENPTINDIDGAQYEMLTKLIDEAIEKQIPKKPIEQELTVYSGGTRKLYARCPICKQPVSIFDGDQNNKEFRRDEDVFCSYCGQKLDWSDSNDKL